ncbi:MAG: methylenetetrahydrofolate reductase [Parvibaculaceae bacterium]
MPTLRDKLALGKFVVTAEIAPPLSASPAALLEKVEPLRGLADAVNVTDAAGAKAAMSSFAAAALLVREGFEPVLQITCRDRNRIALAGDLLGAAAQGVENLLILHGDEPSVGDMPEAKPVYDLDSRAVMTLARDMRERGELPSGRKIAPAPRFLIGCADSPVDPAPDWKPKGLEAKIAAGAEFAQTQFCFDLDVARRYVGRLAEEGTLSRLKLIVGVGVLASAKQARFMRENLFGVFIPDAIVERLDAVADPRAEGRTIAAEVIAALRDFDGVAGVHVMAPLNGGAAIADTLREAGVG